jgi:hypothetical protein
MGCTLCRSWKYSLKILHFITAFGMGIAETIIIFIGHMGINKAIQQVRNARVFLTTSFVGGNHATILEAMIFGPAVVISKSNPYVEPKKNGYIIERVQAEYYVERYEYLLDNVSLLLEISSRDTARAISYVCLKEQGISLNGRLLYEVE